MFPQKSTSVRRLHHGDMIDLTDETEKSTESLEYDKTKDIVTVTLINKPAIPIQQAATGKILLQKSNVATPGNAQSNVVFVVNKPKNVGKQKVMPKVNSSLVVAREVVIPTEETDKILSPSPSNIRQKKFPIDNISGHICSDDDDDDDVVVVSETVPNPNAMATITPLQNSKGTPPSKEKALEAVRKAYSLTKSQEISKKASSKDQIIINKVNTKSPKHQTVTQRNTESVTKPQKGGKMSTTKDQAIIEIIEKETSKRTLNLTHNKENHSLLKQPVASPKNPDSNPPPILIQSVYTVKEPTAEASKGPREQDAEADVITLSDEETAPPPQTKQFPKIINDQKIIRLPLDKSKVADSLGDIVETVSAVAAITPQKDEQVKRPVYFLVLDPPNTSVGQVNRVLALVPKNSDLVSSQGTALEMLAPHLEGLAKQIAIKPGESSIQAKDQPNAALKKPLGPVLSTLKPTEPVKKADLLDKGPSTPIGVSPPKKRCSPPKDPIQIEEPLNKLDPPENLVQVEDNIFIYKNTPPVRKRPQKMQDPIQTDDPFAVPAAPLQKKTVVKTIRILQKAPLSCQRRRVWAPSPRGDVEIEPPALVLPVDIAEIINQGKQKSRCQCPDLKSADGAFKGFSRREMTKPLCLKELPRFVKKEEKKVATMKKSMKKRYESNFVSCGGDSNYFIPELSVKSEVDDDKDALPTISEVISKVNKEVLEIKKQTTKNAEVSKRNEALELIRQGLEMMKQWSQEPTVSQPEPKQVEPLVIGPRSRKKTPKAAANEKNKEPSDDEVEFVRRVKQRRRRGSGRNGALGRTVRRNIKKMEVVNTDDTDDLLVVKRVDIIKSRRCKR